MHDRSMSPRSNGRIRPSAHPNSILAIPKTGKPSSSDSRAKSLIHNILQASPMFPIFYADIVMASAPNSKESNILATS